MATRLSTAEILAAARAADGKRSVSSAAPAVADRTSESKIEPVAPPAVKVPAAAVEPGSPEAAVEEAQPPTMASILKEVRTGGAPHTGTGVPKSMQAVLDAVRSSETPSDVRPASMSAILQRVREVCGTSRPASRPAPTTVAAAARTAASTNKKLSTAEILAAARRNAKPAVAERGSASDSKPAATARTTAEILAAARSQGAGKADRPAAAKSEPKPKPVSTSKKVPKHSEPVTDANDGRPRPPAMADVLASVRTSTLERQSGVEYPPLSDMLKELRRLDRRGIGRPAHSRQSVGFLARIKRWFSGSHNIHQGASI